MREHIAAPRYAAGFHSGLGRNLATSARKKSKPRNGAREIFVTTTAERTRVCISAANSVAFGGRKAAQNRDEIDFRISINTNAISDTYCWLGRHQSQEAGIDLLS